MSVDLTTQTLLSLMQAAALLPGRPNVSTLHRWRLKGVRGVKLQTWLVGGRRYTDRFSVEAFIEATTAAANGERHLASTAKQRELAIKHAERELDQAKT